MELCEMMHNLLSDFDEVRNGGHAAARSAKKRTRIRPMMI